MSFVQYLFFKSVYTQAVANYMFLCIHQFEHVIQFLILFDSVCLKLGLLINIMTGTAQYEIRDIVILLT
jgi:hypothetical protein